MSAMTFYAVSLPTVQDADRQTDLVFENRDHALKLCKKYKGARFKCFTDRDEALKFTLTQQNIEESNPGAIKELPSEKLPFSMPSPQDMLAFRKIIEANNKDQFLQSVWKNPRFLISSGDTPTMIRERYRYHTLLHAAFKKSYEICKALLDTITNPNFIALLYTNDTEEVRKNRMFYVLDTYLNTPDKFLNETPLHFASKFGSVEIVQLLVSYPECDRERKNNKGETPADIICSSCKEPEPETIAEISSLLSQRYFVPVLRMIDYSAPAVVGKPWSPDVSPGGPESPQSIPPVGKHPADSPMVLQALAGPMSPKEAEIFYQKIKTPPVSNRRQQVGDKQLTPKKLYDSRLLDIEKGLERIGRNLAKDLRIPWCEYWSFLGDFCDLSTVEGLQKLETYFQGQKEQMELVPEPEPATSPLSELCQKLSSLRLQSPVSEPGDTARDQFFTPPSTPPSPFYEILPFYISGSEPTKIDVDVLRVLEAQDVDYAKFPNINIWKENMQQFNEEHLSRLRTPATVKKYGNSSFTELQSSPRASSISQRLNSPRKVRDARERDLTVTRLSKRFEALDD